MIMVIMINQKQQLIAFTSLARACLKGNHFALLTSDSG